MAVDASAPVALDKAAAGAVRTGRAAQLAGLNLVDGAAVVEQRKGGAVEWSEHLDHLVVQHHVGQHVGGRRVLALREGLRRALPTHGRDEPVAVAAFAGVDRVAQLVQHGGVLDRHGDGRLADAHGVVGALLEDAPQAHALERRHALALERVQHGVAKAKHRVARVAAGGRRRAPALLLRRAVEPRPQRRDLGLLLLDDVEQLLARPLVSPEQPADGEERRLSVNAVRAQRQAVVHHVLAAVVQSVVAVEAVVHAKRVRDAPLGDANGPVEADLQRARASGVLDEDLHPRGCTVLFGREAHRVLFEL